MHSVGLLLFAEHPIVKYFGVLQDNILLKLLVKWVKGESIFEVLPGEGG